MFLSEYCCVVPITEERQKNRVLIGATIGESSMTVLHAFEWRTSFTSLEERTWQSRLSFSPKWRPIVYFLIRASRHFALVLRLGLACRDMVMSEDTN